ncbi:MAG: DEAD/DEAH box helicase [Anaerolineales bacterium]
MESVLQHWRSDPGIFETITTWQTIPARPAQLVSLPEALHPLLITQLERSGIHQLFSHQSKTWEIAASGKNLVLTTGTASGKSLAYNLAILDRLYRQSEATALYLFPTKALAQDQSVKLQELLPAGDRHTTSVLTKNQIGVYDGDTPSGTRSAVRKQARILITNPDMLHLGILPHHTRWAKFFSGLQMVVIDEVHTYRGIFGSHIANILRRLQRIANFHGGKLQFFFTSATIGNPQELCSQMIGAPVALIDEDGAARGTKEYVFVNPPVINAELGLRRNVLHESQLLADELRGYDLQTLIFTRTRRSVEILLRYLQEASESTSNNAVRGYRSGYLPKKRREIEQSLRRGDARIVVSTNALELGIDLGGLEAVVIAGYPGSIASTWQQAGRAGRAYDDHSVVALVFSSNPLDQYLARHPEFLLDRNPERAFINPDHPLILFDHIQCAAYELPFTHGEGFGGLSPSELENVLLMLTESRILHHTRHNYMWIGEDFPAARLSLRSASSQRFVIQSAGKVIGEIDQASVFWMLHPEAIYLQEGVSFHVNRLDLDEKIVEVEPTTADYFTEPKQDLEVKINAVHNQSPVSGGDRYFGELTVISQVTGYKKIQWGTNANLGFGTVDLPPVELITEGYWLKIAEETIEALKEDGLWSNEPNDYGPNWNTIRAIVLARDDFRCQVCGLEASASVLHIHHKVPFRAFDTYHEANQLTNLVTLCPVCHRKVEQNVRIRSGLAGLGYALVNLAPLFLMCDRSDLGLFTDPKSKLTEGLPLMMIYENIPAGIGLSRELFERHVNLISGALELINNCACTDGCPACVGPGGENGAGGKKATRALLQALV